MMELKNFRTLVVIALFAGVLATTGIIYGMLTSAATIGSHGTIKAIGVEVYWDEACTKEVSSIDWGMVEPDSSLNSTVYVKNVGNHPITLTLSTENWDPPDASNYIALSWDYNEQTVEAGYIIEVTLTLTVSSTVSGIADFSFDIVIAGYG